MGDTRENIIDQAYGLFLTKSYEAVSISDISKAIGLTKGALYHHFLSKEELFMAVVDKNLKIVDLNFDEETTTLIQYIELCIKKAKDIVGHIFSSDPAFIPLNLLSLYIDAFRHYPGFTKKNANWINSEMAKTKMVLDHSIAKGEIKPEINTTVLAEVFFTLNTGIARNLVHSNMSPEMAIEQTSAQFYEFYKLIKL